MWILLRVTGACKQNHAGRCHVTSATDQPEESSFTSWPMWMRAMQHLSLEGAPICILIVQDNIFITMLEGGHYMASRHPEKPHIYLPKLNLWALLWLVIQSHHSPKGWKSYSWSQPPLQLSLGSWGTERQTESTIALLSQLEYICHQFPGLVCYHLERSRWQQKHCSWILQLKNISDYLCRCLSSFQLQQHIINWVDYKQTYFKYFWRLSPRLKCLEVWHLV